ncbi:hypothetical protein BH09PSE2_BH09PSE2_09180 [soil metagenome]
MHERLERSARPFSAADYLRAQYADTLRERFEEDALGDDDADEAREGPGVSQPSDAG